MQLPTGIDAILGMGWMTANNLWLHPSSKRIVAPNVNTKGHAVLTHLARYDEDDVKLARQARLSEHASRKHARDKKVPPSSHDKREPTPLGLSWISKDKQSEGYNVCHYIGTEPIGIAKIKGESGYVAVYIDDLIVFSADEESHARHLLEVMQVCSDELLYLNTTKSHLFCEYTRYLGAVCGNGRLFMDPKKVEAIVNMPSPKESQTQIREFLGNCSFYRRWIDSYAKLTTPLTELLKDVAKGKTLELWTANEDKYEKVVSTLKSALCSYPVLRQPNFEKPFVLYTDASNYAIGGVICQLIDGKMCAIHYVSRSLQGPELNYSVQEKEALGIIFCVKKFRKMILGSKFKIRCLTDHKSLECLTNSKEIAGRMARWAMIMSEYNYKVEYIKGVTNTAADGLSRLIAKPESVWTPLKLEDADADTEHPFLLLWPDVTQLVAACQYYPSAVTNDGSHLNDR